MQEQTTTDQRREEADCPIPALDRSATTGSIANRNILSGRDILVLSDNLDGLPTSTIHLFRHLGPGNRVFWINVINRMPRASWNDVKKVAGTLMQWSRRKDRERRSPAGSRGLGFKPECSLTPPVIPWFKRPVRRLNRISLLRTYRRLERQYGIESPIVVTTWPSTVDFLKAINPALTVYYCVDQWSAYPGLNAADFRRMERELIDHADAFVATARDLLAKGEHHDASLYLPQGVDFDHFHGDLQRLEPVPEMERIGRPIVGFFGVIAPWIDLQLIATLGKEFPEVSFVMIGRSEVPLDPVANCANVHCLGLVPYADLPRYARYFDVGLIPFVTNELTEAVNPLKLMEYFALGLPVLATRLRDLAESDGPIHLASTREEFCAGLKTILEQPASVADAARRIAGANTWQQRAEKLSRFIENLL